MALGDDIRAYLEDAFLREHEPFCFCVDASYRLTGTWGDGARYGLADLATGGDMLARAPWLLDQLGAERQLIPFVTTPATGTVEIHVLPRRDDWAVLLLSREQDHRAIQVRQQSVNENRLLQAEQDKLIRRQNALIDELVETRAELDLERRLAERASLDKSRFLAMMSHEFRTPLASIIGLAEKLADDPAGTADSIERIGRAARHLHRLVDTVLDDARLEDGERRLALRPVDLRLLVDDLAAIVAPLAAEKALSFAARVAATVPERVEIDDGCLRQLLLNLLGNAVKFTGSGRVSLALDWHAGTLRAVVADTGPGIPPAEQARLFEAYERGERHERVTPGSGLGLAISLELARLMRGELALESATGEGCRLTLAVPARELAPASDDPALAPPGAALQASAPATVLVCDDDEDMRAIHEYYLGRAGYDVLLTGDGRRAVEIAAARAPDLVLLDVNLPGLDGPAAAAAMREGGLDAPIVALSAADVSALDERLFAARLRKPLEMPRLLAALKDLLRDRASAGAGSRAGRM